ncbi:uncharacterized protein CLUP02_13077 [Colletotrichum lupini]|uniref:Uncharacterized protein n=1 Tax=Colletotrichum lupini TaxID=145971 RepID=A0A9Q8WLZ9_9PEZI|nr:uncharacterized protein CLUP02_13077 [Colletotrichum lupini]UQC87560.1 hypothetical protein CLUP02_13077 [Colletotrichum lupini]
MSLVSPISSETGIRNFQREIVDNAVQKLVDEACSNTRPRCDIGSQRTVTFGSHNHLRQTHEALSAAMEHMPVERPLNRKPRRRARAKGNGEDQFCIYHTSDGQTFRPWRLSTKPQRNSAGGSKKIYRYN